MKAAEPGSAKISDLQSGSVSYYVEQKKDTVLLDTAWLYSQVTFQTLQNSADTAQAELSMLAHTFNPSP